MKLKHKEFQNAYFNDLTAGRIEPTTYSQPTEPDDFALWMLQVARYRYAQYCAGLGMIGPGGYCEHSEYSIAELREYATGNQPIGKYRQQLDVNLAADGSSYPAGNNSTQDAQESLLNISWKNINIWGAYLNRLIDRIAEKNYAPGVVAIDDVSMSQKKMQYLRDKVASSDQFKAMAAAVPTNISPGVEAMSPDDVDVLQRLGGYSTAAEIQLSEFIKHTIELSSYDPVIRRQVLNDLGVAGVGAVHIRGGKEQTVEYIDPPRLICAYSPYADCRDIDYAGFTRDLTLSALRAESGLPESSLYEIAKTVMGHYGNSKFASTISMRDGYRESFHGKGNAYDSMKAEVLTLYFIGTETERFVSGYGRLGGRIFDKVKSDSKLNKRNIEAGKSLVDVTTQYVYRVNWVVGTDYIYDYGKDAITPRDGVAGNMRAVLPVVVYRTFGKSMTEEVIPIIDDFQIAILKGRSIINKMPPSPGIGIDFSALENGITISDIALSPEQILDIFAAKGYLYYKSRPEYAMPGESNQARPIFEIPDTTLSKLQTIDAMVDRSLNLLRMISGMNEVTDGTGSSQRVGNGTINAYQDSTNRALSELYVASDSFTQQLVSTIGRRYQAAMALGPVSAKKIIRGTSTIKELNLLPEYSIGEFVFYVKGTESRELKQQVLQTLMQNRQNATINEADYLLILRYLNEDQVELAQFYLVKSIERKAEQEHNRSIETMQAQSAAQAEAAKVSEQAATEREVTVMEQKAKQLSQEYDLIDRNNQNEHLRKLERLRLGGSAS